jgi:hypothetical protein
MAKRVTRTPRAKRIVRVSIYDRFDPKYGRNIDLRLDNPIISESRVIDRIDDASLKQKKPGR